MTVFLARRQRCALVASTNDVVSEWLADGTQEVCHAVADEQSAGRGRADRTWVAPRGSALLLSLGFRPVCLAPEHAWRLVAIAALAMADAAEMAAGLPDGAIRLKWPNDLLVEPDGPGSTDPPQTRVRKLAGLLGETDGLGTGDPRVIVGLGINADWAASDFPRELAGAMTSLRETSGGHPIATAALLDAFVERLETRVAALRRGEFDVATWQGRQLTTGRLVRLELATG